jgi:copper(I)-binding protein
MQYYRLALPLAVALLGAPAWADLSIEGAWVRALPPTQSSTAAYLSAVNDGEEAVRITGASAPVAGEVQIHTTRELDGMLRMERVPAIDLAPGERVELAPGGMHLMLLDLERMPALGDSVKLCLLPAGGGAVCTTAEVRRDAGGEEQHHGHH